MDAEVYAKVYSDVDAEVYSEVYSDVYLLGADHSFAMKDEKCFVGFIFLQFSIGSANPYHNHLMRHHIFMT